MSTFLVSYYGKIYLQEQALEYQLEFKKQTESLIFKKGKLTIRNVKKHSYKKKRRGNINWNLRKKQRKLDTQERKIYHKKIKITISGSDYVISYGGINDADGFTSVTIPKKATHGFTYFSF